MFAGNQGHREDEKPVLGWLSIPVIIAGGILGAGVAILTTFTEPFEATPSQNRRR